MSKIQKSDAPINYKYGLYFNFKAFKDYHLNNNINDDYFKPSHNFLLAFIVEEFYKNLNMPMMKINNEKYVLMNTNYILDNLIYLKVDDRMLKKYLVPLKTSKLIKIHIEGKRNRYINVNKELIHLCYNLDYTISATNYLEKNKPQVWKVFKKEWETHFKSKSEFKHFIDNFNDTRVIEGHHHNTQTIYDHLINSVKFKLYGKKS